MRNDNPRLRFLVCICASAILLSGCGMVRRIKEVNKEMSINYAEPKHLDFDPDSTGILLIDADLKAGLLSGMSIVGAAIVNIQHPNKLILSGNFCTGGFLGILGAYCGPAVFAGLSPGTYRILKIKFGGSQEQRVLFMPPTRDQLIEIETGKTVYHGRVVIRQKVLSSKTNIKIEYNREREIKSWRKLAEKYKKSPWIPKIDERIASLKKS